MGDEGQEYEVESIQEAVVEKKGGKKGQLVWKFRVRWRGYPPEEDTWEPIESFDDSEHIIDDFWSRTKDKRDVHDLSQFRDKERFLPLGPPARKPKKKKSMAKLETHPREVDLPQTPPDASKANPPNDAPTMLPITISPPPPGKRRRGVLETGSQERASKRLRDGVPTSAKPNRKIPAKTPAVSGSKPESTPPSKRQSTRRRKPSPEEVVPDSDEEAAQLMKVDDSQASSPRSVRDEYGFGSASPPVPSNPTTFDPLFDEDPDGQIPAHRLKEQNPRVKNFKDPALSMHKVQLSAKSRAVGPIGSSARNTDSSTSQRPGPGRSSSGMIKKPAASLLTASKGSLKSIKGTHARSTRQAQKQEESHHVASEEKEATRSNVECVLHEEPPTAQELLDLAGFDEKSAEALPAFEDVSTGANLESADSSGDNAQESTIAQGRAESLNKAKESLFPTSAVSSEPPSAAWNRSTIFGPLTAEPSTSSLPMEGGPDLPKSSPFSLNLDASTSVPVLFTDAVGGGRLGPSIPVSHKSLPGQFYFGEASSALLNAVRSSGEAGRVIVRSDSSQDLKQHFLRFSERLQAGDLFVATAGIQLYAFCSSDNRYLCSRMNISPGLQVAKGQVLVCKISVGDFSGYAEVAGKADSRQWSQYVASLA